MNQVFSWLVTPSGMTLLEVATELSQRLIRTFLKDAKEVDTTDF